MSGQKIYKVWIDIKTRCLRPKCKKYKHYGGRGIKICDRWKDSFETFYADMSSTYKEGLCIDRRDNEGNYTPENCRWVTYSVNNANRRSRRKNGKN